MTPERLAGMRRMLQEIARNGWLGELAQRCTAGMMKITGDGFRKQTDPYGKAWAPLARERTRDRRARLRAIAKGRTPRGGKVLHKTGRMENSVGASATGSLIRVVIPVDYAEFHQGGTVHMVRRMILPDKEMGVPEEVDRMISKEAALLLAQKFAKVTG
jgi:phage gpG-like protein